jgi:hypothetical protein
MAIKTFTTGEVLTASDTNTYLANAGLDYIKEQTIGNAVTQQNVPTCFSSTYTNYRVLITGGAGSSTAGVFIRLGNSITGYYEAIISSRYDNVGGGFSGFNNQTNWQIGRSWTDMISLQFELLGPQVAKPTTIQGQWNDTRVIAGTGGALYTGVHTVSTSYTDFTVFWDGATTFTGGTIAVYGYRKA